MPAVMTLKNVVIGAMFGFAATGYGIASAHASVTTAPDNHLLSTLKYVELEAEQGDKNMQLFLGRAYIEGSNGLKADPLKGMYWLKKAADDTPAVQAMIGDLFKNGRGLPRDNQKAIEWYTKAANEGSVPAMVELGHFYASGGGTGKTDCANAIKWFNDASNAGSMDSKRNLVWLYATCSDKEQRDGERALKLAKQIIKRSASNDAGDYDNLAAAYAACGEFNDAVKAQQVALSKLEGKDNQRLAKFSKRLELYKQNQTIYSASL
ncbi:tetratricopeptide repeat protein [Photobacterium sanguinicancri]|uniref:tetratricopeptide repeat protein n=1 Tax=Photobacterium sanguinicancri TaxID=875932 RepID=UPI0026E30E5F|nr:tetratricopeptide repeat protein [Photobacterium sanguinicancri]MDO6497116.1 tetratricopeptide repeat protein [Photobacterium sanguinicancri]